MNPIHAFPMAGVASNDGWCYDGMTLRDYFAAHALTQAMRVMSDTESVAVLAYGVADAMLAEREKVKP